MSAKALLPAALIARLQKVVEWSGVGFWLWMRDEDHYSLDYFRKDSGRDPQDLVDMGLMSPARLEMLVERAEERMREEIKKKAGNGEERK